MLDYIPTEFGIAKASSLLPKRRHVLVVSPTPSHPQNQGNNTRVFSLCRAIQELGCAVHFVYVPLEGMTEIQQRAMRETWDSFHLCELVRSPTFSSARGHLLDDWYQPSLDTLLDELFRHWIFDAIVVNYVWFSRALLRAPSNCMRIIDTHDVFGGRASRLIADGMTPNFFFTSPDEESRGLDRADMVFAIQSEEACVLAQRTQKPVEVVGHIVPETFLKPRPKSGRLRVGYIASGNPINCFALTELCRALASSPELNKRYDFVLAGPICNAKIEGIDRFEKLGYVKNPEEFYRQVDLVINPNIGGTGLKIKSVEALAYGRPLIATADAVVGIKTTAREHLCRNASEIVDILNGTPSLESMTQSSRTVFLSYQATQIATLSRLFCGEGLHSRLGI